MRVIKRKNEFIPYKLINNNYVNIMWDYQPIKKTNAKGSQIETPLGTWEEHLFDHIPDFLEIKKIIIDYYNNITNNEILSGLTWNGLLVWLSNENQFNYKSIYDLTIQNNGKNLPVSFKLGDDEKPIYYKFKNIDELKDFYFSCINHIQKKIQEGWEKKEQINWNFYKK